MTDANAIRFNIAFILWCALFLVLGGAGLAASFRNGQAAGAAGHGHQLHR